MALSIAMHIPQWMQAFRFCLKNNFTRTVFQITPLLIPRLINTLLKAAQMPTVPYRKKANATFVALSNLDSFLGAVRAFGVSDVALFQPSDLYEGRKGHLLNALNCLDALGRLVSPCNLWILKGVECPQMP